MKSTIVLGLMMLALPAKSFAWYRCPESVNSSYTVISTEISAVDGDCAPVPLRLIRGPAPGGLTVDQWAGGYSRLVTIVTHYQINFYDGCTGGWLYSEDGDKAEPQTLMFNIDNPNLAGNVPSYVANAPLTPAEAQGELGDTLKRCQAVAVGPYSP